MATYSYRPIKKWLVPLLAVIIGITIGYNLFPTKQEHLFKEWNKVLEHTENQTYQMKTIYEQDQRLVSEAEGYWGSKQFQFHVTTVVSDTSEFIFDIFLEDDRFFIHSDSMWFQGKTPHRIMNELSPLDHPFAWSKDILREADQIIKKKNKDHEEYQAVFESLNRFEFNNVFLEEQKNTTLTMTIENDQLTSIYFHAQPIKPENLSALAIYPEEIKYTLLFSTYEGKFSTVPEAALEGTVIE